MLQEGLCNILNKKLGKLNKIYSVIFVVNTMIEKMEKIELIEKYWKHKLPDFYRRLDAKLISTNPCFNCLKETEITVKGSKWKTLPDQIKFWYEMCDAENRELRKFLNEQKPRKILEVGFGSGRIINIILSIDYSKEVFAIDKNKSLFEIVKPLFESHKNVHLLNVDLLTFLKSSETFDLAVCMLNTLGNFSNEKEALKLLASKSKQIIFTAYDKSSSDLRTPIYKSKGHIDFVIKDCTYYFNDSWLTGLKSRSYSGKELAELCRSTGKDFIIKKISKLLFWVHLY